MTDQFASKKIVPVRIDNLQPHPEQAVFNPHSPQQIKELADSLKRDKLINAVEITPTFVIICGHGRVAAARLLGWTHIHCWVRHDLVALGASAVMRRLIEDNLHRRQLTNLGLGRAFLALKQVENAQWRSGEQEEARGDFRDYLGERLGVDGTTAERWSQLAVLPLQYEPLIELGLLSQQQAKKIVKVLPADTWDRLGQQLVKIMDTAELSRKEKRHRIRQLVDADIVETCRTPAKCCSKSSHQFCRSLKKALDAVPAPVSQAVARFATRCNDRTATRAMQKQLAALDGWNRALDAHSRRALKQVQVLIENMLAVTDPIEAESHCHDTES